MAAVSVDVSRWQQRGGTVLQYTASNGRIRRTFVAPSGEKFRTWKECLKYMDERFTAKLQDDNEFNRKKRAHPEVVNSESTSSEYEDVAEKCSKGSKRKIQKQGTTANGVLAKCSNRTSDEAKIEDIDIANSEATETQICRKMPKRAAAKTNFKEKRIILSKNESLIEVKQDRIVEGEDVAIVLTAQPGEAQPPQRKLMDFIVHDEDGKCQPIELIDIMSLYLTTRVVPLNGVLGKDSFVRCEGFGPLESWSIAGYENGQPLLWLCTDAAEYICGKPAGVYKRHYDMLLEKATVCVEIYRALSKPDGGDPDLSLDGLIARVSRALLSTQKSFGMKIFTREYILSQGRFIVNQLTALDQNASADEQLFSGLPALLALETESRKWNTCFSVQPESTKGTALKMIEPGASATASNGSASYDDCSVVDDEKLARLLQEQEDRKAFTRQNRGTQNGKCKYYIKINEDEIAGDYPLPSFYKAQEEEIDEYILFDDDTNVLAPEDLPRRMLHDWALYNSDSRFIPLELLPMLGGTETDMDIFGSGIMTEDDGSGYCVDQNIDGHFSNIATSGCYAESGAAGSVSRINQMEECLQGVRIYLSAIKEWVIEFGASMLFISIRTDGAWYRLGKPSPQYAKWYKPVLKTAMLAVRIITMLKQETRASKLSFQDVVKKLAEQQSEEATFISSKVPEVERYVVVHGQIILQQFAEYPDENIKKSAFVTGLTSKMEEKHHVKLVVLKKKVVLKKGRNLNPSACFRPDGTRPKPMRATTTKLVHRIWSEYYSVSGLPEEQLEQAEGLDGDLENDEQEEAQEESDVEEETILALGHRKTTLKKLSSCSTKTSNNGVAWLGKSIGKTEANEALYMRASVHSVEVGVGGAVFVDLEELREATESLPGMLLVEYLYEKMSGLQCLHGRVLERGSQTVLGNAANSQEVFLTRQCADVELASIKGIALVQIRKRSWGYAHRKEIAAEDEANRTQVKEQEKKGLPVEYFCQFLYYPERGAFLNLPRDSLALGNGICRACQERDGTEDREKTCMLSNDDGFRLHGETYHLKDFMYLSPETFPSLTADSELAEKFKSSRNRGLKAFAVCQLLDIKTKSSMKIDPKSVQLSVRRFFRPEDVDPLKAYTADVRELYYSEEMAVVGLERVRGKCEILKQQQFQDIYDTYDAFKDIFFCSCIFDPKSGTVKQLPTNIKLGPLRPSECKKGKATANEANNAKRKGKGIESEQLEESVSVDPAGCLTTLDIFAGCGGLSEGLRQSGVSLTKWAIEYEHSAAEAFRLNHPHADVFCENCNVILRCIMEKAGDLDDCLSTPEAELLSHKLSEEERSKLPIPGQVDFINGGPPCQGFSGMNRFSQRAWSKVQCEMILSFLSYADYFRPRYFLLENVRNFVSYNKGQTFRLTLVSLLEMGYQVRFGVLQAGNYGVSQSRKRAFIWAASPGEVLPEWPEPRHVFASSQLNIVLPGGLQYAAVRDAAAGAPLRSITVRDTIGDLPAVGNGSDKGEIAYGNSPQSWFQKHIRGQESTLHDHISKEMNELNCLRCQRIPKRAGADWRDLPSEKVKLSTGQIVDLIPWCLPNTADRHNQWKGLFGRLDWDGNFPTSVTDPQPMGKVGMCFHPEQDRIVTVRECARSQGFPDSYKFYGNIQSKHRQIGNAVPPPLARALGDMLKEALDVKEIHA